MEILKGKVQDPGFPDTEVTYLKTDDGKTYFFIENGTLKNGNIISTPILKEGIGHAPYTSLGLIDKDGNVLIPFENKNIKALSDDLLLVEKAKPTTQSVVDAASKQTDPLSAAELIQTSDTIKSQMKSVMGSNSSYVFDNQFSEAALFTASGVNLANNYFSFIGLSNGAYYMSQNVVGSPISKYDPYANAANQAQEETNQVDSQESNNEQIEQQESSVENTIQNESFNNQAPLLPDINMDNQEQSQENQQNLEETAKKDEQKIEKKSENIAIPDIEIPSIQKPELDTDNEMSNQESNISSEDVNVSNNDTSNIDSQQEISENNELSEPTNELSEEVKLNIGDDINTTEEVKNEVDYNNSDVFEEDGGSEQTENSSLNDISDDETSNNSTELNQETDVSDDSYLDGGEDYNSNHVDENLNEQQEENSNQDSYEDNFEEEISNPVIINATNTIKKLLEENRKQRQIIDRQEGEIETLNSTNEILKEDNSEKTKEIISLRKAMSKYRSDNTDLTRENNHLKSTNSRQEEIIDHLKTQNTTLKEQVAGITALGNAVAEANTIFTPEKENDNNDSDSNIEFGYLGEDDGYQYTKKSA
ncbi:MAG: hypothetical protein Q4E39_01345 [bacterium]|nr:hypothetical protein [bacterium]